MQRFGLLYQRHGASGFALSSMATVSIVTMSKRVPVKKEPLTAFECRANLIVVGWHLVDTAYECSVSNYRMMKHQCAQYFRLLQRHYAAVLEMTNKNSFSHAQCSGYFQAVEQICKKSPFAL